MKSILTILTVLVCFVYLRAQHTITATYTTGDIPTSFNVYDDSCNGPSATLTLTLPPGDNYTVTNVDVAYNMTALGSGWRSDQRSKIRFQNTNAEETEVSGTGDAAGTQSYERTLSIANGTYTGGTELVFQMRARRTFQVTPGCNTSVNRVDATSWTITVHYGDEVQNPKVGVNTSSPAQTLDVLGKLRLGDDNTAPVAGTIRWNAATNDFEGYNGTEWVSFTKNEGGGWGKIDINENESKIASDGAQENRFGYSVSISGDYAIVGAYGKTIGGNTYRGKAYIFMRSGTTWTEQAGLVASDGASSDFFGESVSISGDYAIVGASRKTIGGNTNQGKAYIFMRSGGTWTEQAGIVASDGASNDFFSYSVSISGDYAIIGAYGKTVGGSTNRGKAYIFMRSGTTWTEQAGLVASDGAISDFFGSVSISGDYAIVGAWVKNVDANSNQGKAYIYKRSGTTWTEQAGLVASDGASGDYFGSSVSISGDYAIVGASVKTVGGNTNRGKAYIFIRSGTTWTEQAGLIATDGAPLDQFGVSVTISGDYAIIGAFNKTVGSNINQGKAYIFKRSGTNWTEQADLIASDGASSDFFGRSVSISCDYVIVGAWRKYVLGISLQGKVYFFNR